MAKFCSLCKEEKVLDEFRLVKESRTKTVSFYPCSVCKICEKKKALERYHSNRDTCIKKNREYKEANLVKINKTRREYTKNLMKDPLEKLKRNLKSSLSSRLKNKSSSSLTYLGTNVSLIKEWIDFNLTEDMSWDNYGTYWQIDHCLPIGLIDMDNHNDVLLAFSWMNLMPLSRHINSKKSKELYHYRIFYQESRLLLYSKIKQGLSEQIREYIKRYTDKFKLLLTIKD